MNIPIYLINLDENPERLAECHAELTKHGLTYERVPGVLGKELSTQEIAKYYDEVMNEKLHYRTLSKGEVGCYLSHRECWKKIANSKAPYGIVLEDDINITGDVERAMELVQQANFDWDLIKLAPYSRKTGKVVFSHKLDDEFDLVIHKKPMSGCAATIYSKAGAEKLLATTERFFRAVDTDIQYFWEKGINVWSLAPYIFEQNLDSESTIAPSRKHNTKRHWRRKIQQVKKFFNNRKAVQKQVKLFVNSHLVKNKNGIG